MGEEQIVIVMMMDFSRTDAYDGKWDAQALLWRECWELFGLQARSPLCGPGGEVQSPQVTGNVVKTDLWGNKH